MPKVADLIQYFSPQEALLICDGFEGNEVYLGAWVDYVPTHPTVGTLTFTSTSLGHARYRQLGKTVFFSVVDTGNTGGTAAGVISTSLPVVPKNSFQAIYAAVQGGGAGGTWAAVCGQISSGGDAWVINTLGATFASGISVRVQVAGVYEAA